MIIFCSTILYQHSTLVTIFLRCKSLNGILDILIKKVMISFNLSLLLLVVYLLQMVCRRVLYFIFDPHSRNENGFVSPNGTAVLLKFSTLLKAQDYIKFFFFDQFDHCSATIAYECQLFNIEPSQTAINSIKTSRRLEYKSGKLKHSSDQSNERVAKYRASYPKKSELMKFQTLRNECLSKECKQLQRINLLNFRSFRFFF